MIYKIITGKFVYITNKLLDGKNVVFIYFRLKQWNENNLYNILCETAIVPIKTVVEFPMNVTYVPLSLIKDKIIINEEIIEEWFRKRRAGKGLKKGRILALKLFIKFTKAYVENNLIYIKTVCAGEMKKHTEYCVSILLKKKSKYSRYNAVQLLLSCWSWLVSSL